jgi:AraC family transcriptional regulator
MSNNTRRLLDAHRIIRPDQIAAFVPAKVTATGGDARDHRQRIAFRDYTSSAPGQVAVPGIDSVVLIIYRNTMTRLRRRLNERWKDEQIPAGGLALVGGRRPTELEWESPTSISHLYLSTELMVDTAAALEQDYSTLEIIDPLHFENPQLLAVGDMIIRELSSPTGGPSLLVDSLAAAMSVQLIHHYHRRSHTAKPGRSDVRLSAVQRTRVLDFIEANISRNFRLQELAAVAGLSEVHFGRCFTNTFGESPHQFVLKQRTRLAVEQITGTKLTFAEIAERTGFADQAHLTRVVKKSTGHAPRTLRKS